MKTKRNIVRRGDEIDGQNWTRSVHHRATIREMKQTCVILVIAFFFLPTVGLCHDEPDPVGHWIFSPKFVRDGNLIPQVGPGGALPKGVVISADDESAALGFLARGTIELTTEPEVAKKVLPEKNLTVSAWLSVDQPTQYGGIAGYMQDNGDFEKGWVLGYDTERFTFALSSVGADDGNGKMTYLRGTSTYEKGKFYHVVGVYDGEKMELYVNGKLDSTSTEQSGAILYPDNAPLTLAGYKDANEHYPLHGRVRSVAIYDLAAKAAWVEAEFKRHEALTKEEPVIVEPEELEFVVEPYLQFATQTSITVMWETTRTGNSVVRFGETDAFGSEASSEAAAHIHTIKLSGLKPSMEYFYQAETTDSKGQVVTGPVRSFQTAVEQEEPFAFVIVSDTQSNPKVAKQIAEHAWGQRPHFVLHPGDLVGTGANKTHWIDEFFPSMQPLISRTAFFPVLGNHEGNAQHYYDYVSLPDPEYFYTFTYGNAQFFMIDTNKNVSERASNSAGWMRRWQSLPRSGRFVATTTRHSALTRTTTAILGRASRPAVMSMPGRS